MNLTYGFQNITKRKRSHKRNGAKSHGQDQQAATKAENTDNYWGPTIKILF